MKKGHLYAFGAGLAALATFALSGGRTSEPTPETSSASLLYPGEEKLLANVRQLTFGGQNAEAYWSAEGSKIIFQSNDEGRLPCDQIFTMNADGSEKRLVSNGLGKTTCSFFFPSGDRILYSSTFGAGPQCPPPPDRSRGYVWALDDYDIYTARPDASEIRKLFGSPAYDAEATISRDGKKIVFTSARDGDLEIYSMNAGGSGITRLTHHARLRRRPLLFLRRQADRLPSRPSENCRGPPALQGESRPRHLRS